MGKVTKKTARPQGPTRQVEDAVTEAAVDTFATEVMCSGRSYIDAYRLAYPSTKANGGSLRAMASAFAKSDDVQRRMGEIRDEMRKSAERFRERLVGYHIKDIDNCMNREGSITNCMAQVASVRKILGMENTTVSVEAKVAAVDAATLDDKLNFLFGKEAAK